MFQFPPLVANVPTKKQYLTLDNGGHPFKVVVENGDKIVVWAYNHQRKRPYISFKASRVFVGKSPLNDMTKYSGGDGEDGTSILLQKAGDEQLNEYYFVGDTIFKFRSFAPIVYFTSPVGNSSVPYPWAHDQTGHVYLFLEKVVLKTNLPAAAPNAHKDKIDPYSFFYGHSGKSPADFQAQHPVTKKIYNLTWSANPAERWDFTVNPHYGEKEAFLELGKEAYVATIKAYGEAAGMFALQVTEEIAERQI